MINVYIVEDNPNLLDDMVYCLNTEGHSCHGATDATAFDALMTKQLPDIVILDWELLGENGLSIAKRLRADDKTRQIGIIFLTAKTDLDNRLAGLDVADAYHIKPMDFSELSAVISSMHRRITPISPSSDPQWQLHQKSMALHEPLGGIISLSYREYTILNAMIQSNDATISVRSIIELWGEDWVYFEKNRLELFVSRLRTKIKVFNADVNPIRSIRHKGYILLLKIELKD